MKTILTQSFRFTLLLVVMLSTSQIKAASHHADPVLFSISIPESWQSSIVRQDFENQSIFSLKNGTAQPVFLFSISKTTGAQWQTIHSQLKNAMIIENKEGYILYVEKNDQAHIKGSADALYQQIMLQLNTIIQTVHVNS